MRNSRIKQKIGQCSECPEGSHPKPLVGGRCSFHHEAHKRRQRLDQLKEKMQSPKGLGLEQWFAYQMQHSLPRCENCGARASWLRQPGYERLWKSCQAHILPKRDTAFPSVATCLENHLVLFSGLTGVCNCHDQFDSSWAAAYQMPVWPRARKLAQGFIHLLTDEELGRLPPQLLLT